MFPRLRVLLLLLLPASACAESDPVLVGFDSEAGHHAELETIHRLGVPLLDPWAAADEDLFIAVYRRDGQLIPVVHPVP